MLLSNLVLVLQCTEGTNLWVDMLMALDNFDAKFLWLQAEYLDLPSDNVELPTTSISIC